MIRLFDLRVAGSAAELKGKNESVCVGVKQVNIMERLRVVLSKVRGDRYETTYGGFVRHLKRSQQHYSEKDAETV